MHLSQNVDDVHFHLVSSIPDYVYIKEITSVRGKAKLQTCFGHILIPIIRLSLPKNRDGGVGAKSPLIKQHPPLYRQFNYIKQS